jgi:aminocarboxymuconate-semialdehyde decarboxylase
MTPMPGHFDYDLRVKDLDLAGVDLAIVSLTCPNVFWGDESTSCEAARIVDDSMAKIQGVRSLEKPSNRIQEI